MWAFDCIFPDTGAEIHTAGAFECRLDDTYAVEVETAVMFD